MRFTSLAYLGFFIGVFVLHWAVPAPRRWMVCLGASAVFLWLCGVPAAATLCVVAVCSYVGGLRIESHRGSRGFLLFFVCITLLPLLFFKYFDGLFGRFVPEQISAFSRIAPLGVSFFTFKAVAYLAEVYKGTMPACRNPGKYALYVSFFPQVTMGPIQRPKELLAQFDAPRPFDTQRALIGAQLVLWGMFEKLVIADNLPYYVSIGFDRPETVSGTPVFLATLLYALQIYTDFSGYTHIAIGCARLLGFETPDNFRSPYFATSLRDFWNRWHISLSGWLRDYIYIPLGGSRCGMVRCCINLWITFLISGLWHGTGKQFIVWGLLHGSFLVFGRLTAPVRSRLWAAAHLREDGVFARMVKTAVTFGLVWFGWVFFRAASVRGALRMFRHMIPGFSLTYDALRGGFGQIGFFPLMLLRIILAAALLLAVDFLSRNEGIAAWLEKRKPWQRRVLCYIVVIFLLFCTPYSETSDPIYFAF